MRHNYVSLLHRAAKHLEKDLDTNPDSFELFNSLRQAAHDLERETQESRRDEGPESARGFLEATLRIMDERAKEYEQPGGERSASKISLAFNAITGKDLTPAEVYLLQTLLKFTRQWSSPSYHLDSAVDAVGYTGLMGEELRKEKPR